MAASFRNYENHGRGLGGLDLIPSRCGDPGVFLRSNDLLLFEGEVFLEREFFQIFGGILLSRSLVCWEFFAVVFFVWSPQNGSIIYANSPIIMGFSWKNGCISHCISDRIVTWLKHSHFPLNHDFGRKGLTFEWDIYERKTRKVFKRKTLDSFVLSRKGPKITSNLQIPGMRITFIYLSIYQSINLSIYQSINQSIYQSINLSI